MSDWVKLCFECNANIVSISCCRAAVRDYFRNNSPAGTNFALKRATAEYPRIGDEGYDGEH